MILLLAATQPIFSQPSFISRHRGHATGGAVLDLGDKEAFDAAWVTCPAVLRIESNYHMWYSSLYDSKMGPGGIGLATSTDGIRWERRNEGKPALTLGPAGGFDEGQVMGPAVHFDGKVYRMWYTGMTKTWHKSGIGHYRIGLATSRDGVRWERANNGQPVLDLGPPGSCDEVQAATPSVLRVKDGYRMWYAAWAPQPGHTIAVARSPDGLHWQRENNGHPVAGLLDGAYGHDVCRVGQNYLMLYMTLGKRGLHAATSKDGLRWDRIEGPVLLPGSGTDFDEYLVAHPCLLPEGDRVRVWYCGYRREPGGVRGWKLRVGLAEFPKP